MFTKGYYQSLLKKCLIVPMYNDGHKNEESIWTYIKNKDKYLEEYNIMSEKKFGFQEGRSTYANAYLRRK